MAQFELFTCLCALCMVFIIIMCAFTSVVREGARMSLRQFTFVLAIFGAFLVLFAYSFTPNTSIRWDLLVHYEDVNQLRGKNITQAFNNTYYSDNYFLAALYFWLISRLPDNRLLPVFPVILDYAIFVYIFTRSFMNEKKWDVSIDFAHGFFVFFLWMCTFGMKLAISGIRCVTACAICSLAIFFLIDGNRKKIVSIVLFIMAIMIHSFALMAILIWLFSKIRNKKPMIILVLLINSIGLRFLEKIYDFLPDSLSYLRNSLDRSTRYWSGQTLSAVTRNSGYSFGLMFLCMLIAGALLLINTIRTQRNNELDLDEFSSVSYTETLSIFILGFFFNYLYVERLMYLFAYGSVIYFSNPKNYYAMGKKTRIILMLVALYIFYSNDIGTFIANYTR
jgi:hypothetical protein